MTINVTAPDGSTVQFPDGTDHATIDGVMTQHFTPDASLTNSLVRSAATGVSVAGGVLNKLDAATNAALAPVLNPLFDEKDQLREPTWSGRYQHSLRDQNAMDQSFEKEHPVLDTAAKIAGGIGAGGALLKAAPVAGSRLLGLGGETLPGQVVRSAASGAGISAADAAVRGENPVTAAATGGIVSAAAPVVGRAVGSVVDGLRNVRQPAAVPANTVDIAGVPVRRSLGQLTGDVDTQMLEQGALRNTSGQREQQVAQDFFDAQNKELGQAKDAIASKLNPAGTVVAENPQAAAEQTADAIRSKAAQAKAGYQGKYDEFASLPGEIHAGAFEGIGQKIKGELSLGDNPVIVDDVTTPHAARAIKDIENNINQLKVQNRADPFGQPNRENIVGVSLQGVDQTRKRLLSFARDAASSGNAADARATKSIVNAFDNHVQNSIDAGLFSGDERALDALKEARGAYANYRKTFTSQGAGDDVGRVLEKIVGKNGMQATPTEVANYLYGSSNVGATGLSVRLGQRLKQVLGEASPEWSGVKQGLWSRMVDATEGRTEFGPQKQSQRIFEFLNGSGKPLSQVMFSPQERQLIEEYGKLQNQLTPKPGTVNHSNTAATLGKMMRGSMDGLFAAGGFHLAGPLGLAAGMVGHTAQKALTDVVKASKVARALYGTPNQVIADRALMQAIQRMTALTARGSMSAAD
jgi:hypothetical protein